MKFKEIWEKVKKYDYKKLLCVRNYVIAGCVALLAVAVVLNATLPRGRRRNGGQRKHQNTRKLHTDRREHTDGGRHRRSGKLFCFRRHKQTAALRDEAMAVLREVADSPDAMRTQKKMRLNPLSAW